MPIVAILLGIGMIFGGNAWQDKKYGDYPPVRLSQPAYINGVPMMSCVPMAKLAKSDWEKKYPECKVEIIRNFTPQGSERMGHAWAEVTFPDGKKAQLECSDDFVHWVKK